jgi:hypothetical protein
MNMMISFVTGAVLGAAVGAGLLYWRNAFSVRKNRRIPQTWPLKARPLVNSNERRVWIWLTKVMFDQHILIKLPVTRFTTPFDKQEARHWYKLLNGVYCTFTVCSLDGRVIGCVDIQNTHGLSLSNQTLKHSLLAQCGLRYWVVDPDNLPHLTQLRTAFLGDKALKGSDRDHLEMRFKDVAGNLQAAVSRQRDSKSSNFARLDAEMDTPSGFPESRLASGWEQNSFISPLDSRAADLQP